MKAQLFLFLSLLIFNTSSRSQDAAVLLKKAHEKCVSVEEGYYELTERWKPLSDKDTVSNTNQVYFTKMETDDVFGMHFKSTVIWQDTARGMILYDGENLANVSDVKKEVLIRSLPKWKEDINNVKHNYRFYDLLSSDEDDIPIPDPDADEVILSYVGKRTVDGKNTHHIKALYKIKPEKKEEMSVIFREQHYFINEEDHFPYRYTERVDVIMGGDTMIQYKEYTIRNSTFNSEVDRGLYSISSLPADYNLKEYSLEKEKPLLERKMPAPAWTLETLDGDSISLTDFKNKIVLLDFFYKGCYPCMLALPALQSLHERYKDKGLVVIGIDPFDSKEDNLKEFLAKRNVSYLIAYADRELPNSYNVTGYPTLYLVDGNGDILHSENGYSENMESSLGKVIEKHLKKK